jgi:starch synthase
VFKKLTSRELLKTTKKALEIFYKHPEIWRRLQENGMKQDWSWTRPAKEYLKLYKKLAN